MIPRHKHVGTHVVVAQTLVMQLHRNAHLNVHQACLHVDRLVAVLQTVAKMAFVWVSSSCGTSYLTGVFCS